MFEVMIFDKFIGTNSHLITLLTSLHSLFVSDGNDVSAAQVRHIDVTLSRISMFTRNHVLIVDHMLCRAAQIQRGSA